MTRADRQLLQDIEAAPAGSIHWRNVGSGKVEVLSIVNGRVTRLGTTKDEQIIKLAEELAEARKAVRWICILPTEPGWYWYRDPRTMRPGTARIENTPYGAAVAVDSIPDSFDFSETYQWWPVRIPVPKSFGNQLDPEALAERLARAESLLERTCKWFEQNEDKLKAAGIGGFKPDEEEGA